MLKGSVSVAFQDQVVSLPEGVTPGDFSVAVQNHNNTNDRREFTVSYESLRDNGVQMPVYYGSQYRVTIQRKASNGSNLGGELYYDFDTPPAPTMVDVTTQMVASISVSFVDTPAA